LAKIIYFSRDYTPHDYRFLAALGETDHQIFYLRLEQRGHALEQRSLPKNVERVSWQGGKKPYHAWDAFQLRNGLKTVIDQIQPDLIQAGPLQSAAFLVALYNFKPLVSTSWGYDLLIDAPKNIVNKWITYFVLKRSAIMVGDCQTIRQAAQSYGMPEERIITFPWGVDIQHFYPVERTLQPSNQNVITLLSTRSWEEIYGIEEISRAFVQASQQRPDLRLIMLGNGSKAKQIHQIFSQGNVLENVTFAGQISQENLPAYYQKSDIYISASHSDGTSISLLEAMACGKPAIVSDIPGNREWIKHGVQGWLFEEGNISSLANTIRQASENRKQLVDMGHAARNLAEQRADWKKNFPELLKAYERAWDLNGS
jgi:glycosyltransferase involved in cell wall biosynthesis